MRNANIPFRRLRRSSGLSLMEEDDDTHRLVVAGATASVLPPHRPNIFQSQNNFWVNSASRKRVLPAPQSPSPMRRAASASLFCRGKGLLAHAQGPAKIFSIGER